MIIPTFLGDMLHHLNEGAYILDQNRTIIFWNKPAEKLTGFSASEVIGKSCKDNVLKHVDAKGTNLCDELCPMVQILSGKNFIEADVFLHHKEGFRIAVHVKGILIPPTFLSDKATPGEIYAIELFTPLWQTPFIDPQDLINLALQDSLTKSLNRRGLEALFYNRLQEMLSFKKTIGIIFVDLDDFKQINDTYGHRIGDQVLINTAKTLQQTLRPFDLVGRWGGEEFIVVIFADTPAVIPGIAERFRHLVNAQFIEKGENTIVVSPSIGATLLRPAENLDEAISRADHLMYQAKRQGKNRVVHDIT